MDFKTTYEGHEIKIEKSNLSGKVKVFLDGNELQKEKGKGKKYKFDENTILEIKNNGIDLIVPKLSINDSEVLLMRKLVWYEIASSLLPFPLLAVGGALGGGLAGAGFVINLYLLRSGENKGFNILKVVLNSIAVYVFYFIIAYFLQRLFK